MQSVISDGRLQKPGFGYKLYRIRLFHIIHDAFRYIQFQLFFFNFANVYVFTFPQNFTWIVPNLKLNK